MQSVVAAPFVDRTPAAARPCPAVPPTPWFGTASASIALHVAALCLVCLVAVRPPAPSPEPQAVTAIFTPPAPAAPVEQELAAETLPHAAPMTQIETLSAPAPLLMSAPRAEIHLRHAASRPAPPAPAPHAQAPPALIETPQALAAAHPAATPGPMATPLAAPPASAPASHDALAALESRIRQSVQDALVYPSAARMMHREGRTQVAFDYTDGSVDTVAVAVSSRMAVLDSAALSAVRHAALPRAPHEIGGRKLAMLVWVTFTLEAQE